MPRLSGSRIKRKARLQTSHQRSYNSSWFKALEILDERKSKYLVRWAGKDPSTGREWVPSWEPKRNCSPELVRSWKAIQKANNSNTRFPTSTTAIVHNQISTVQSAPARRTSARLSAARQPPSDNDTRQSSRHLQTQSIGTITRPRTRTNGSISKTRPTPSVPINSQRRKTYPSKHKLLDSLSGLQHLTQSSTKGNLFEALEILAQDGNKFQVSWAGFDPSTGKQWEPTWVLGKDCTAALLGDWKKKHVGGKNESPQISTQHESSNLRSSPRKHISISQVERPDPHEQVPSEALPIKKSATIPPRRIPRKRNSTFNIVIPAKGDSRTHNSRSPVPKYSTRNVNRSTTETLSTPNDSSVNHELTKDRQSELPASAISHSQVPINSTSPPPSVKSAWPNFTPIQTYWLRFTRGT